MLIVILLLLAVVVLIVATVFVTALTASYASLERRLERVEGSADGSTPLQLSAKPTPVATGVGGAVGRGAHDLAGVSLAGDAVAIAVRGAAHDTVLAFLSSGCTTCGRFWAALRAGELPDLGDRTRLLILTKSPEDESMTALRGLAEDVDVVMTTKAWHDYEVPGTPFFILVDGASSSVAGEGTAMGWDEVRNLIALGRGDASVASGVSTSSMKPSSDAEREAVVDQILMDAGIFPGDPSLYPGTQPPEQTAAS